MTNEIKMKTEQKTLIVEDVPEVLRVMEGAFRLDVLGEPKPVKMSRDSVQKLKELGLDVAVTYREAEDLVDSRNYDFILLDHNLPYSVGESARDIGYGLISKIKQRNPLAVLIGTSSNSEVRNQAGLDYILDKSDFEFGKRLATIYGESKIKEEVKGGMK